MTTGSTVSMCAKMSTVPHLRPDQHPWLAKVPAPASFLPEERIMTFLAGIISIAWI
jgi:hypothetical protein